MTIQQDRLAEDGVTKLLDINASDKIQILSAPIQLPGCCGLCGTSRTDDRDYIDIGLWVEFYGQWYFCTFCMTQMTNRLGGLTAEQAIEITEQLNQARQTILDFQEEKASYDGAINTLRGTGLFSGTDLTVVNPPQSVAAKQDTPELSSGSKPDEHSTPATNNDSTKPVTEQGADGISGSTGDELDKWL